MKIALIRLSALGDIIQSAIILQFIKNFNKNIEIHWFVDERFEGLLEKHPLIDKLYALPLKEKRIFTSLGIILKAKKNDYDAVIDLQGLIKSAFLSRLLGKNTFGFDKNGLKESFAHNFYKQKLSLHYNENVFVRYLALAAFMLNAPFNVKDLVLKQPVFSVDSLMKEKFLQELPLGKKNVLIHTGSSQQCKIYPQEKFANLCKLLCEYDSHIQIFLTWGNEGEKEFAQTIQQSTSMQRVQILPFLTLQELLAVTKIMNLIIGADTGPTHLAFAMNRPSITLFGSSWEKRNCLQSALNKTLSAGKSFDLKKKYKLDTKDFCITKIDEKEIFVLARELLG
ncbi:lipopolysaccharide heptosyltransferase I [Campylobacter sp. MIT 21-1685]|uniref:lipopolysaccharide heptosyltransferase I n=1 Tax=unclassified Campylobacter TaxID=2593542 RepID=UPI00224ABEE3|nr:MULTISPECIES: lipopolysaccharide heptosyltransferase I [unclassified Campylobacter]MCX2683200.1 lipopolysaccharide heptosyltransferase I [Campylobacter sp. MIT 21-1684]MCX2751480.1 lipopolysaccharide heptosyltransferase I [Campylobacter sp. MIT 21-1682]MCX2807681.1 lipopolysaccharide heptosyltransferase I [Campylobacter sp. MIT 21-1685]